MHGTCCCTRWHRGHVTLSSFIGMGTCVRNDSELTRASLSASFVSFKRRSSSCRVIRDGILANCANMSKQKGVLSPLKGFFFRDSSKRISFCFSLSLGRPRHVQWFLTSLVGVLRQVSGYTVTSTIYQNVYPPAAMWKAVLLRQASLPLNR